MLAHAQGLRVHTIIVTAGEKGLEPSPPGYPSPSGNPRLAESYAAARILGLEPPVCWHLADRELRHAPPLIDRIIGALQAHQPRWLLLPALTEPHPDHQALALAGMAAAQRHGGVSLLFYEVGAPTQPNTMVDISAVAERKWRALEAFASQEERHAYRRHAQAMATVRAFVNGPGVQAAEAYWQLPAQALAQDQVAASLGGWPLQRNALQLASTPQQLPLVSVIIRSMNRPSLIDAIASVAAQTYPNIEIIVVNACGGLHPQPAHPAERLALLVVGQVGETPAPGGTETCLPLDRSAAANLGLRSLQGEFGLFLDDDDLLQPTHLHNLLTALQGQVNAAAAYSGVRVEGPGGQWLRDYDTPWQRERLWGINYLPIHAVLFRISAVRAIDAHFDEQLPVMEDWDFWCQLSHHAPFVHVPGIGATYRQGLGTSQLGDAQHVNYWAPWHRRILEQHASRWGADEQSATLAWHAVTLDRVEQENQQLQLEHAHLQAARAQLQDIQEQLQATRIQLQDTQQQLQATRTQLQDTEEQLQATRIQLKDTQQQLQATRIQLQDGSAQLHESHTQLQITRAQLHVSQVQLKEQAQRLQGAVARHAQDQQALGAAQQQLQQAHMKIAHWQSAHALAERSLQMLQQSRAVRGARALRRLLGLAR